MAVWFSIHIIPIQYIYVYKYTVAYTMYTYSAVWTTNEDAEGNSLEEGSVE